MDQKELLLNILVDYDEQIEYSHKAAMQHYQDVILFRNKKHEVEQVLRELIKLENDNE